MYESFFDKMNVALNTLPSEWAFVVRGGANAIYRYTGKSLYFQNKLLRLRLKNAIKSYVPTKELCDYLQVIYAKLPPGSVAKYQMVYVLVQFLRSLASPGFMLMISERFGLLMHDMLSGDFDHYSLSKDCILHLQRPLPNSNLEVAVLELKPKWLYHNQSMYCRNCSVSRLRGYKRHFCPLDLLDSKRVETGLRDLFSRLLPRILCEIEQDQGFSLTLELKKYFCAQDSILRRLASLQNIEGVESSRDILKDGIEISFDHLLSMTLRDVGLFVRIRKSSPTKPDYARNAGSMRESCQVRYNVETTLFDFDLKSKEKITHWADLEEQVEKIENNASTTWTPCSCSQGAFRID